MYAVFDRDDHPSYFAALDLAKTLDGKLQNDEKQPVAFKAIASIPSFELWLLLHYESIQAPIHRDAVLKRLKQHLPHYEKGAGATFATTRPHLEIATQHAQQLATQNNPYTAPAPYTGQHELVTMLTTLRHRA